MSKKTESSEKHDGEMGCTNESEFLLYEGAQARSQAESRTFVLFLMNLASSFKVFAFHLIHT
jgi:hypothetical protein